MVARSCSVNDSIARGIFSDLPCTRSAHQGVYMSRTFDSIIIGSVQAGPFLAARPAKAGQTVALVERKVLGGTCVNTGCTPT